MTTSTFSNTESKDLSSTAGRLSLCLFLFLFLLTLLLTLLALALVFVPLGVVVDWYSITFFGWEIDTLTQALPLMALGLLLGICAWSTAKSMAHLLKSLQ